MIATQTIERPLEPRDVALLRALRTSLAGGIAVVAMAGLVFMSVLAGTLWILLDRGIGQGFSPELVMAPLFAAVAGMALLGGARGIRLFRGVGALLRQPARIAKKVSVGELTAISRERGRIRYDLRGEIFEVWLPIPLADTGRIVFERAVPRLDGLLHRRVLLEWLAIDGESRLLLLRVDYPDDPPVVTEHAPTERERRAVAWWDHIAYAWFMALLAMSAVLAAGIAMFAFIDGWMYPRLTGGLLVAALPIGAIGLLTWRRTKRWLAIQPRMLQVTGVIAEVLDKTVSIGRYAQTQRWYRIGDRLYATRQEPPRDNVLSCGTRVRIDYVDRSPLGGWIVRIEPQAQAMDSRRTSPAVSAGHGGEP